MLDLAKASKFERFQFLTATVAWSLYTGYEVWVDNDPDLPGRVMTQNILAAGRRIRVRLSSVHSDSLYLIYMDDRDLADKTPAPLKPGEVVRWTEHLDDVDLPQKPIQNEPDSVSTEATDPYLESMKIRLQKEWSNQKISKRISKGAQVIFRVQPDGQYSDLRLDQSTGLAINDQASLETIERSGSFDKLPDNLEDLVVTVRFSEAGLSIKSSRNQSGAMPSKK